MVKDIVWEIIYKLTILFDRVLYYIQKVICNMEILWLSKTEIQYIVHVLQNNISFDRNKLSLMQNSVHSVVKK